MLGLIRKMKKILAEIRKLEDQKNFDELGSYLINLVKYGDNPIQYENEFNKHFNSQDSYLRKVSVFCLLFALQIDKPEYRNKAVEFVKNSNEDEEVRRWSASGLSQTYQKTKDKELLKLFFKIIDNPKEDEAIKESLLNSALLIYGLTSREQFFRNKEILPKLNKMLATYKFEIDEIQRLIK